MERTFSFLSWKDFVLFVIDFKSLGFDMFWWSDLKNVDRGKRGEWEWGVD